MVTLAVDRIIDPVEGMHRAIAAPSFTALGAAGRPIRTAHDTIAGVVYGSIRFAARAVGAGLDARRSPDASSADPARAFVNGLWGDALGPHEAGMGISMSLRDAQGVPVLPGADLAAALPAATDHLVVLVHGLTETERCWHRTDTRPGLMDAIDHRPEVTPLALRYNTGLAVAANGAALAALLEEIHDAWPVPVRSVALVGHSMGGLVVRSACAAALDAGYRWVEAATDVVTIGSPHRGAPLEKFVTAAALGLRVAPQTRPLADFLDTRSRGIKDLRTGNIGFDHEWGGAVMPSHLEHHFVAGVITSNPAHPMGAVVGDLMVRPASSTRAPSVEPANVVVVGGVRHFDLRRDPAVIDRVMAWIVPSR